MVENLDDLRRIAVKHILRKEKGEYLLRQALCKPWIASEHLNEMAWTDYKKLFFNFPKIRAQLDSWQGDALDPGDITTAHLAAVAHEILHNLWLHRSRSKGKHPGAWRQACEWAINLELSRIYGTEWIQHLNVNYPTREVMVLLRSNGLLPTTDGFYQLLVDHATKVAVKSATQQGCDCNHCDRPRDDDDDEDLSKEEMIKVLITLPEDSDEKAEILRFIADHHVPAQPVPWEMLLMGGIEDAVHMEQTFSVPSRRHDMWPGYRHEKLLSFVWILDVSPSIDAEMKQSFMNTLQAGINLYHDALHRVIFFAEGIVEDITISSGINLSQKEIPCGNGTNLNEVWAVLEQDKPDYALVLTDLELYAVPKPSHTQIIWGIVGDDMIFDPDYGTKIFLK